MTRNTFPRAALAPTSKVLETEQRTLQCLNPGTSADQEPLHGWYFTVTPVGTIETLDTSPPATFLAGDGMVFRLSLSPGKIVVDRRRVVDPTYIAQKLLHDHRDDYASVPDYEAYGVAIVSIDRDGGGLGSRVLSNTSVHAVRHDGQPFLLVTTDGGRPMVVDPRTMETVGALGSRHEWKPAMLQGTAFPFVNTTAHPAYDTRTGELFSVEFARDLWSELTGIVHVMNDPAEPPPPAVRYVPEAALGLVSDSFSPLGGLGEPKSDDEVIRVPLDVGTVGALGMGDDASPFLPLSGEFVRALRTSAGDRLLGVLRSLYRTLVGERPFTNLKRWDAGLGPPRNYELVDQAGKRILITDSIHQVAVTRSYVILADTRFKFAMTLVLSNVLDQAPPDVARLIRRYVSRPQAQTCPLYFVPRSQLAEDQATQARAFRVELNEEVVHFFADYEDGGGSRVVLWVAHQCAMDGAEFVARSDVNANDGSVDPDLVGMFPMSLDLNNLTRYVGDPVTGTMHGSVSKIECQEHTWAIGIGAGPGIGTLDGRPSPPDTLPWTLWYNEGFLPELLTRHVYRMYRGYKGRTNEDRGDARVGLDEIRRQIRTGGTPGSLFRADVAASGEIKVRTAFRFPPGLQIVSPQYVPPRVGAEDHGHVVAIVFRSEGVLRQDERTREVWVFRADNLTAPILRFDADPLGWQYTLHTAWLAELGTASPEGDRTPFAFHHDRRQDAERPADSAVERLLDDVFRELPTR